MTKSEVWKAYNEARDKAKKTCDKALATVRKKEIYE